ncbi:uncharacterized protein LOC116011156 isoform X1 [Ipomoea triloba]|uniref:uncharacterized protein LOC116011156 isoform X1 n=1 Tax=Ipomoea triloba TaxID=35885 RepID=UPI00125E0FD0|nr:uncharacterized protein LOC116011156 isoform X1 [Ipomoea triloba]
MGEHLVLCVDRLITPESVQTLQWSESAGPSGGSSYSPKDHKVDIEDLKLEGAGEDKPLLLQSVECRICQEEDDLSKLEVPCACSGSLKKMENPILPNNNNEDENVGNNSGGSGNNVAHFHHAPVNTGSLSGGSTEGYIPTIRVPVSVPSGSVEKPEKFTGSNFKRWQQKMLFYLTTLGLARFLIERVPELKEQDAQSVIAVGIWKDSDFLCRNYILNGLCDALYDVYRKIGTAKALWEALDHKYQNEDAGAKKFVVGRFLDFKMVNSKTVLSQVEDLQLIFDEIHDKGMVVSEAFQVESVIHLLPLGWKDFKHYLKQKRKEMNLEDLIQRL